jgi:tetratricopeptide (TPR) repeat protein
VHAASSAFLHATVATAVPIVSTMLIVCLSALPCHLSPAALPHACIVAALHPLSLSSSPPRPPHHGHHHHRRRCHRPAFARQAGYLSEAFAIYTKALELKPADPVCLLNMGGARQEQGRFREAIVFYEKILETNPQDTGALNNIGGALMLTGA